MKSTSFFVLLASLLSACGGGDNSDADMASNTANESSGEDADSDLQQAEDPEEADADADEAQGEGSDTAGEVAHDPANDGATEGGTVVSAVPAICESADDCPEDIECVKQDDSDQFGYCDVGEIIATPDDEQGGDSANSSGGVSLAAPAICESADDCPEDIECVKQDDSDQFGYCDVDDVVVIAEPEEDADEPGGDEAITPVDSGDVSLAAPAICESADDCPPGIDCVKFDEADQFGFCNVEEMLIEPSAE